MQTWNNLFKGPLLVAVILINVIVVKRAFTSDAKWYYMLIISLPLAIVAIIDYRRGRLHR
jgi:hypothetical protein